jgi:hypothetical protein
MALHPELPLRVHSTRLWGRAPPRLTISGGMQQRCSYAASRNPCLQADLPLSREDTTMTKLKLSLDDLKIDSFVTTPVDERLDAVHAHSPSAEASNPCMTCDTGPMMCTPLGTCQIANTNCDVIC